MGLGRDERRRWQMSKLFSQLRTKVDAGRGRVPRRPGRGFHLKRAIDVVGAGIGLLLLSPVLAATALAVLITNGLPIAFRQVRPGLRGEPFRIVKFRTMRALRPGEHPYESDPHRVTPVGRFLRSTSLDELPELWNVLRGDMSLVGPRPLLTEYLSQYSANERRRHEMRPGITGWAAVNGRNAIPFRERLALDVWYIDHWSLRLDLQILAMTVYQVLRRQDVVTTEPIEELGFPIPTERERRAGEPATDGEEPPHPAGAAR